MTAQVEADDRRAHHDAMARAAVARYDVDGATLRFIRYGENTTYAVVADNGRYALRLHRPGYQTAESVASEIVWTAALSTAGVQTATAIPGHDGAVVQRLGVDPDERLAVLFAWEDGQPLVAGHRRELWERLGEMMGRIHRHGREWEPPNWFVRRAWDIDGLVGDRPHWGNARKLGRWSDEEDRLLRTARDLVHERLADFGRSPDRYGLIHADLCFENVLVRSDSTTVLLDFDDGGYGWFLYDLAVTLFPLEAGGDITEAQDALVAGYRRAAPLPDGLLAELPTFLAARRLVTLGWTLSRGETEHARRQRQWRVESLVPALQRYLAWAGAGAQG